jgi:hypothetical protein
VRISTDYFMRGLKLVSELHGGELLTGLVSLAIVQANVAHIDFGGPNEFDGLDTVPPDSMRRPVSVLAVSASLGLPYETTRRHVAKLIKFGQCRRVKGGVVVPAATLINPVRREMVQANKVNLRRLFRQLRAAGINL